MNHKLANVMKMWMENGNTTTFLFSLEGLEILHQETRGQVNTIVMEHFNRISSTSPDLLISSISISQSIKVIAKRNFKPFASKAQMTLKFRRVKAGSHRNTSIRGILQFKYVNLDGVIVYALV